MIALLPRGAFKGLILAIKNPKQNRSCMQWYMVCMYKIQVLIFVESLVKKALGRIRISRVLSI